MATSLLMGKAPGEMNLAQLRGRAEDLRRTLDQLINLLQYAPERLNWSEVLDRFTVVNVQCQHLEEQLRPMLRHWVAHPKSVNQANAAVLPIMLATKLLPEVEAEQEQLLQQAAAQDDHPPSGAAAGASLATGAGPLPVKLDLQLVRQRCEAWNAAIRELEDALPKAGQQRAAPPGSGRTGAAGKPAAPAAGGGAAGAGPGRPAAGPPRAAAEMQGPELLLAAASYGAGLSA